MSNCREGGAHFAAARAFLPLIQGRDEGGGVGFNGIPRLFLPILRILTPSGAGDLNHCRFHGMSTKIDTLSGATRC
jgi:hypothetical protein